MTLDLASISLDTVSGESGKWFPFFGDARLKIASSDSPRYKGYQAKLAKEHSVELDDANPDQYSTVMDVLCRAMAKFVLLGWEGITVAGKEVPYSEELGVSALKESPKLYEFVAKKAGDINYFSQAEIETAKKS